MSDYGKWQPIETLREPRLTDRGVVYLALDDAHRPIVIADTAAWRDGEDGFCGYCGWDGDVFELDDNGWHCTRYKLFNGEPTGESYRTNVIAWMDAVVPLPPPPSRTEGE